MISGCNFHFHADSLVLAVKEHAKVATISTVVSMTDYVKKEME
jgi:hypothetical protein